MTEITTARNSVTRRVHPAFFTVAAAALLGAMSAPSAFAQVVYDSTTSPVLPAAPLVIRNAPEGVVSTAADDYRTTLMNTSSFFQLSTLTFYGGVDFTGPANGINNTLVFRFLGLDGSIPPNVTRREFQFASSGSSLQTLQFTDAIIPTAGVIEVTTLPNSGAMGTFAFSNVPPVIGTNDAGQGAGIRAFSLSGSAVAAPEPASAALLLGAAALPIFGILRRRRV